MTDLLWQGKSRLDGAPIVVLGVPNSANEKTGRVYQTYILRSDMEPSQATRTNQDVSICGYCPHRGVGDGKFARGRTCYVFTPRGPDIVYRVWKRGAAHRCIGIDGIQAAVFNQKIRLGTYGDPAAVPIEFWQVVLEECSGWTGYTHQWRTLGAEWAKIVMASVDTEEEAAQAQQQGWRTFRVRAKGAPLMPDEIVCPGSIEAGHVSTCAKCGLCAGTSVQGKQIVIERHGPHMAGFALKGLT